MTTDKNMFNFLSIEALERAGIPSPTQEQIDFMEAELTEYTKDIGTYINVLEVLGVTKPTRSQIIKIKNFLNDLF